MRIRIENTVAKSKSGKSIKSADPAWDYGRAIPPELWAHVWPDAAGQAQSPIPLVDCEAKLGKLQPLTPQYNAISLSEFFLEDFHLEINVPTAVDPGGISIGAGPVHKLKNFHVHTPSEHTINGKYGAMELHVVHFPIPKADYINLVVGVLFVGGGKSDNPLLAALIGGLPRLRVAEPKEKRMLLAAKTPLTAEAAFPNNRSYYTYRGSLTTPKCTEGLKWFVFKNPVVVPDAQIQAFAKYFPGGNNRPLQPTNGRSIEKYEA